MDKQKINIYTSIDKNKYAKIIAELEENWSNSAEALSYNKSEIGSWQYTKARDLYIAHQILDMYGYDYFKYFVNNSPHIYDILQIITNVPCDKAEGQCSMLCHYYQRGCVINVTNE